MADMFNTFRDPVYWDWYRDVNGNKTSVLRTNESHVVVNNYIVLMEIPDEYYKVQIEGMSEIPWDKPITNPNQFKVFYTVGWIEFHPSMEAKNVLIKQYYSKGICYIPASRIYTKLDNNGNVTETMQKYVDSLKSFQYRGIYSDEETYYINHQVYYNGSTYICLRDGVKGDNPTDTNTWRVMAGGLNRKGNFDDSIQYNERDIVWYEENHTLYLCKKKPPIGTLPTNQNYWDELLTLNDVVSLINNKIDEIENRMSTIENDYNTKKEQWDTDINNKIDEAEHKIVNVESRMSTIEDDYNNQKSQWNNTINEKVDEVNDKVLDIETRMTNIETEYENNLKPDILQATQNANDKAQLAQISADKVDVVINQYEENVKQNIKILKPYVETYAELLSTYPNPENGWTVKVAEEGKVYRWNEIEWVAIDIDTGDVELAELKADVGNKNNLTTENKNSLVDAINEVNNKPSFDGDYEKLTNKPFIPTKTSELENDADFETVSGSQEKADEAEQNAKSYTDQQITLVTEALSDIETNVGNVETEIASLNDRLNMNENNLTTHLADDVTKEHVVQTAEVNDSSKVPSSAVTNYLFNELRFNKIVATLTGSSNFNDCNKTGMYFVDGAAEAINFPQGMFQWGILLVFEAVAMVQIYIPHKFTGTNTTKPNKIAIRTGWSTFKDTDDWKFIEVTS